MQTERRELHEFDELGRDALGVGKGAGKCLAEKRPMAELY